MIWEVRARLFFDEHDEALDFYHDCQIAHEKAVIVNPDTENAEFATIELIENHHDEDPNAPCGLLFSTTNKPE